MKARLHRNIDFVRIPIQAGVSEYYLPQNVAWAEKKIDEIIVVAPSIAGTLDPVDGQSIVMDRANLSDLYFNLYSADENELTHDMSYEQILHINNYRIPVNEVLSLVTSRLYFTTAPTSDFTLLLYVIYDSKIVDDFDVPQRSVTVEFPMLANEQIDLRYILNTYLHAIPKTLKGIICWNAETAPAYITLRDYALTYNIRDAHSELMRPDMNGGTAYGSQLHPFYTDSLDIDFDYSHIRNAQNAPCTQKITFMY